MQIIDTHTHIGKQNCYEFQGTPDKMIFSRKRSGVSGLCRKSAEAPA